MSAELEPVGQEVEVWNPTTGELVPASDVEGVAAALVALRDFKRRVLDAIHVAEGVVIEESRRLGTKTLRLGGTTAKVSGGPETQWDVELLRSGLEEAGCPPERMADLIRTNVEYKVSAAVAKQLAAANPEYAAAVEAAKTTIDKPFRVSAA